MKPLLTIFAGLLCCLALPALAESTTVGSTGDASGAVPVERPVLPFKSVAGEDGAHTLYTNPALLNFDTDPVYAAYFDSSDFAGEGTNAVTLATTGSGLGAGIGYREVEFNAFGTTLKQAGPRFEECLTAVKRLWTEPTVTMQGSYFKLDNANCSVPIIQKPTPPVWIGANIGVGIRRAARMADAWFINPHNKLDTIAEQMEVYKRAGVNPASGCVPMLLTMPVLFAFYAMLSASIELRGAPFFGWVHDLAQPDPYFVMYKHLTTVAGGKIVPISVYPDFRLDISKVRAAITPRTKVILCNSPCNPTGYVASETELRALAELAADLL